MHMKIVNASVSDEQRLDHFKTVEWPAEDKIHFGKDNVDFNKQEFTYLAEEDGKIGGYIKIMTDMGVCHLDSIIVGREYREKGIGRLLIEQAEAKAKELNMHKMILETGVEWGARAFYEKLGYKVVATLKDHFDHGDFVLMEKYL
jgi:ribosomal protein S18 acetylase RimI-like enzyme